MTAPTAQASEQPAPDIDALLNRANLALARSRRVVASWLPQRAPAPADGAQASEGEDDEDEETFKPVPELLGVGATPSQNAKEADAGGTWWNRPGGVQDLRLRKQLLGSNAVRARRDAPTKIRSKPRPAAANQNGAAESDEEEDGGRSTLGRAKRGRSPQKWGPDGESKSAEGQEDVDGEDGKGDQNSKGNKPELARPSERAKRPGSYLDEVLEAKRQKKAKKKKKREKGMDAKDEAGRAGAMHVDQLPE